MEEKISVNEYVRTKDGIIDKVIIEYDEKCNNPNCDEKHISCKYNYYNEKDIAKHRKKLIDLIEDKDIVEIELSEEFVEKKDKKKLIQIGDIYTKETLQKDIDNGIITRILTILSYNQYMANCYKVGGEDEK